MRFTGKGYVQASPEQHQLLVQVLDLLVPFFNLPGKITMGERNGVSTNTQLNSVFECRGNPQIGVEHMCGQTPLIVRNSHGNINWRNKNAPFERLELNWWFVDGLEGQSINNIILNFFWLIVV